MSNASYLALIFIVEVENAGKAEGNNRGSSSVSASCCCNSGFQGFFFPTFKAVTGYYLPSFCSYDQLLRVA